MVNPSGDISMNNETEKNRRITDAIEVADSDFAAFDAAMRSERQMPTVPAPLETIAPFPILDIPFTPSRNPLVIYHGNCADGFSAAWVFHYVQRFVECDFDFHPGVYGEAIPDVDNRVVYIVDFSYPSLQMMEIRKRCSKLYWFDHHLSAQRTLLAGDETDIQFGTSKVEVYFDLEMSGATIAWDFWKAVFDEQMGPRPLLLGHIEDRDLWRFKLPRTEEINSNVFSFEYTFDNWTEMMKMNSAQLLSFSTAGAAIVRKHHKDIAELLVICKREFTIAGYAVPCASLPYTMSSDACQKMAEEYANGSFFAACYWDTATERKFSLRSTENGVDVSKIAAFYGGGGHKHAAGFSVRRSHELATA